MGLDAKTRKNYFGIRFSDLEYITLGIMAATEGIKLSEMLRICIRESAAKRGISPGTLIKTLAMQQEEVCDEQGNRPVSTDV